MRTILRAAPALLLALAACGGGGSSPPVAITTQPSGQAVQEGLPGTFTVVASNATSYQWRKGGQAIAGATHASYDTGATSVADDGAVYSVLVGGGGGPLTSADATLRVVGLPSVSVGPVELGVLVGDPVALSVQATANGALTYQWLKDGSPIPDATADHLDIASAGTGDAGGYTCDVTNAIAGVQNTRTSSQTQVTVLDTPVIVAQPVGATLVPGEPWLLRIRATTAFATHTYQWQKDGQDLAGEAADTLVIAAAALGDAGSYTCVVTNAAAGVSAVVTSAPAAIVVTTAPVITAQPGARHVSAGQAATFRVGAKGAGTLTYQWYRGASLIGGATGASYTTPATTLADDAAQFQVVVGNGGGVTATSASAQLSVQAATPGVTASVGTISSGEGVVLTWILPANTTGATFQAGSDAAVAVSGASTVVFPSSTTTYTVTAAHPGGPTPYTATVTVKAYTPHHLFVASLGSDDVQRYPVDLSGSEIVGAATSSAPTGRGPIHVAAAPGEGRIYVSNSGDGTISAFDVDAATGALSAVAGSPFPLSSAAASPWASAVSPSGTTLYVACADGLETFAVDGSGALTATPARDVSLPGRLRGDLVIHPSGRFVYLADAGHGLVKSYAVAADGALSFSGEVAVGPEASALALDRAGTLLFSRSASTSPTFNARLDTIVLEAGGELASATTFQGFDDAMGLPFVRGVDGHHGLATSRRAGFDMLFDAYDADVTFYTSYSAYVVDRGAGAVTGDWIDGVIGFSSPVFVASNFDLIPTGDSLVVDRSGALIVLPLAGGFDRLYAWTQAADKTILPVMGNLDQAYQATGSSPAHACFTGTLQ